MPAPIPTEQFLTELKELFAARHEHGKVSLTHKRHTYDEDPAASPTPGPSSSVGQRYPLMLRATDGHKVKLTTIVPPDDLVTFSAAYTLLMRSTFATGLRKRRDKKRGAAAVTALRLPKVVGPKRGAGRKKRQSTLRQRLRALAKLHAHRTRERRRAELSAKTAAIEAKLS